MRSITLSKIQNNTQKTIHKHMNIINTIQAIKKSSVVAIGLTLLVGANAMANNVSTLTQVINPGSRSVDIVDATGTPVADPNVDFTPVNFSFNSQTSTGVLGASTERIRIYNPTGAQNWTVSLAGSATTAVWSDGGVESYDFNDAGGAIDGADTDSVGGQLTVNPATGTLVGVSGCSTSNLSLGASGAFDEGTTDSIDLVNASTGSAKFCRWDLTGVDLSQEIPAAQPAGTYTIEVVLSIS